MFVYLRCESKTLTMTEEWRDIQGYEGFYQVSNLGKVRSLPRIDRGISILGKPYTRKLKGRELSQQTDIGGYRTVPLSKNGKQRHYMVHRLVADAFISKPSDNLVINHKDMVRHNNCVENLEWCTQQYNVHYGGAVERQHAMISKAVYQMTMEGEIIAKYLSFAEASKAVGVDKSNIIRAAKGQIGQSGGYRWRYVDEQEHDKTSEFKYKRRGKYVRRNPMPSL